MFPIEFLSRYTQVTLLNNAEDRRLELLPIRELVDPRQQALALGHHGCVGPGLVERRLVPLRIVLDLVEAVREEVAVGEADSPARVLQIHSCSFFTAVSLRE